MGTPSTTVQASLAPTNKAVAATGASGLGSMLATIILFYGGGTGLPDNVQTALTGLITAAVTLATAYFVPPGSGEGVRRTAEGKTVTIRRT